MSADDRRLIRETLSGDTAAFGRLVRRHQDRLYASVLRILGKPEDAADVTQEAFISAYQNLRSYHGDAEFFTWLYRIGFNAAISWRRRKKLTASLDALVGHEPAEDRHDGRPDAAIERAEDEARLTAALAKLSDEHRTAIVMKEIEGLRYEDMAEVLGIPIGTVRSRLHRARLELHDVLVAMEEGSTLHERC